MNKSDFELFKKFVKYLFPYRLRQSAIFLLSGLSIILELLNPYFSKLIVDNTIINKDLNKFIFLGIIASGIFIVNGLIKAAMSLMEKSIELKARFDLNKEVFSHLQRLPMSSSLNKSMGGQIFNINYDVERVVNFIVSVPKELINIIPKTAFTLIIVFYLDWQTAVFAIALAIVLSFPFYYFTRAMRKRMDEFLSDSQSIFKRLGEVFSRIYLIKALGRERPETRGYLKALIKNIRISAKNMKLEVIANFTAGSIERILAGVIMLFGGFQVIRGRISLGSLSAIMIYLGQLISLQNNSMNFFRNLSMGLISCRRLDKILEERPEEDNANGRKKEIFKDSRIRFNKVNFGYSPQEYILKNLDFAMEKGLIALTGPSGCGKTTLLNLLLRLYRPWAGEILIDGIDIKDLEASSLRGQIGVALQEPFLWNDTVENNLRYASIGKVGFADVENVSRIAGADDFIRGLPKGYGTVIGENGCKISEGQKQRIAIARALLRRPKILILDEAMSSLDSVSEEMIIANIRNFTDIHIVILVSHRLSAVLSCGQACFLKGFDRIVMGRPQELLSQDKDFYSLFSAQIKPSAPGLFIS